MSLFLTMPFCVLADEKETEQIPVKEFNITVASEIMAILCLSKDIDDLKTNIGNILMKAEQLGMDVVVDE